jgi:hypothetical protein
MLAPHWQKPRVDQGSPDYSLLLSVALYKDATHRHKGGEACPKAVTVGYRGMFRSGFLSRSAIRNATKIMDVAIFSAVVTPRKPFT